MNTAVNKTKILSSLFWKLLERAGVQGIQIVVQIVLARLLNPDDYGLIALVMVFITLANVLIQSGLSTALIQKKDADELDFSSVFYVSLLVSGLLYLIVFISAPFIAEFYTQPQLVHVLRVLSITLFLGAFNSVQIAFVSKNMMFKKLFFSSMGSILFSGTIGIAAAYLGWGVWALVTQQLASQLSITIILCFTVNWRPHLLFSIKRTKVLFTYGSKLLVSSLLDTLYRDLRTIIIGRIYSMEVLGFYSRGQQFPRLIVSNIDGSIQSVMLPALAFHQDNRNKVRSMVRRTIVTSSLIMFPIIFGLAVVAEPAVMIVLTEKWLPAVPFLQIFCISHALWPIHTANLQAIKALGRSDIYLKLEIIKKIMQLAILAISLPFGIYAIAWGQLVSGIMGTIINSYPNHKLLDYGYIEQCKDILPTLFIALIMSFAVHALNFLNIDTLHLLALQIIVGALLYLGLARILKLEGLNYLIATTKEFIENRRSNTMMK